MALLYACGVFPGLTFLVAAQLAKPDLVIENVSIIEPGMGRVQEHRSVVIEGDKFADIFDWRSREKHSIPEGAKRIDGTGKFLIPGLWDMHVHWYDSRSLGLFTANGVTGIRIMFGSPLQQAWRERTSSGNLIGPQIVLASPIVDGAKPIWPGSIALADPKDAAATVARLKSEKWDFIKTYSLLTHDAYVALAKEAKKQGMEFEGHVPYAVSLREAAKLGHRSNEHLGGFLLEINSKEAELRAKLATAMESANPMQEVERVFGGGSAALNEPIDQVKLKKLARDLAKSGMWECPTLVVLRSISFLDQESFRKDERLKYMPDFIRNMWNPANDFRFKNRSARDWEIQRDLYRLKLQLVKPLMDAGNRFLAGTDCLNPYCFPGFSLHDELALMVEAGLTPTQALATATINPARFLHQERQWGTIAKGKRADAVLLEKNPLIDIHNTTSIVATIQDGRLFSREELDAILRANEQPGGN